MAIVNCEYLVGDDCNLRLESPQHPKNPHVVLLYSAPEKISLVYGTRAYIAADDVAREWLNASWVKLPEEVSALPGLWISVWSKQKLGGDRVLKDISCPGCYIGATASEAVRGNATRVELASMQRGYAEAVD